MVDKYPFKNHGGYLRWEMDVKGNGDEVPFRSQTEHNFYPDDQLMNCYEDDRRVFENKWRDYDSTLSVFDGTDECFAEAIDLLDLLEDAKGIVRCTELDELRATLRRTRMERDDYRRMFAEMEDEKNKLWEKIMELRGLLGTKNEDLEAAEERIKDAERELEDVRLASRLSVRPRFRKTKKPTVFVQIPESAIGADNLSIRFDTHRGRFVYSLKRDDEGSC